MGRLLFLCHVIIAICLFLGTDAPRAADATICPSVWSAKTPDEMDRLATECLDAGDLTPEQQAKLYDLRGRILTNKARWSDAIANYDHAVALDPKFALAFNNRGTAYQQSDVDRAISNYTQAIELDPTLAIAYLNRGNARLRQNRPDDAIADLDKALDRDPKLACSVYAYRAQAHFQKREWPQAIAEYTQQMKLLPANAQLYDARGMARINNGDTEQARADFSEAIRLDANFASAYNNRGITYLALEKVDLAIDDFTHAIRLNSSDEMAYFDRGDARAYRGDCRGAIADFDIAISLNEKRGLAYGEKAWVLATCADASVRDGKEATALAQKALTLGADAALFDETFGPMLHSDLAAAYAEDGKFADATAEQELAIRLAPKATPARAVALFEGELASYREQKPFRWIPPPHRQ